MSAERRVHPRVGCQLPAELEARLGNSYSVTLTNISVGGCLAEGQLDLKELADRALRGPVELELSFGLEEPIHCHCRLIYTRRLTQTRFAIGLRFLSLPDRHRDAINHFLSTQVS